MDRFVAEQNIAHFEHLLTTDIPADRRATLLKLLLLEETKLGQYSEQHVARIDRNIERIEELIARQQDRVTELNGKGHAAKSAQDFLDNLAETRVLYQQHRASILSDLVR